MPPFDLVESARDASPGVRHRVVVTVVAVALVVAALACVAAALVFALKTDPLEGSTFAAGRTSNPNRIAWELSNNGRVPVTVTEVVSPYAWLTVKIGPNSYNVDGGRAFHAFKLSPGEEVPIVYVSTLPPCPPQMTGGLHSIGSADVRFKVFGVPREQRVDFAGGDTLEGVSFRMDGRGKAICNITPTA